MSNCRGKLDCEHCFLLNWSSSQTFTLLTTVKLSRATCYEKTSAQTLTCVYVYVCMRWYSVTMQAGGLSEISTVWRTQTGSSNSIAAQDLFECISNIRKLCYLLSFPTASTLTWQLKSRKAELRRFLWVYNLHKFSFITLKMLQLFPEESTSCNQAQKLCKMA